MRDRHHILSERKAWSSRPEANRLRTQPTLIPLMDREIHEETHRETPAVPLLGYRALQLVNSEFVPSDEVLRSMDNLMKAFEIASRHPRAHPIDRDLAMLAVQAVELQRPYVRRGLAF